MVVPILTVGIEATVKSSFVISVTSTSVLTGGSYFGSDEELKFVSSTSQLI